MCYSIEINHNLRIISYKHSGRIGKNDIRYAWEKISNLPEFTEKGYNLLTDYRKGIFNFSLHDIDSIKIFLEEIKVNLYGKKNAVIVDKPKECAFSMLIGMNKTQEMNFHVELFSTEEAALKFLK